MPGCCVAVRTVQVTEHQSERTNQRGQYSVGIAFASITADSDDLCIVGEIEDIQWRKSCKGGKQETINQ